MIIQKPLPPICYPGRELKSVDAIVHHFISAINVNYIRPFDVDVVYNLFIDLNHKGTERGLVMQNDPEAERAYASAHYFIARNGETYQFVDESLEAWHAGTSEWNGRKGLNKWSIGVEIACIDPAIVKRRGLPEEWAHYTDEQYAAIATLDAGIMTRHGIPLEMLLGHDQIAPGRKFDPGKNFDWPRLKESLSGVIV